jgi:DNA mismatch endonuclease, patch repair protein
MKRIAPRYDALQPASAAASKVKRRNPAQGTSIEMMLRRRLWAVGLRYRLHVKDLPGKPDLVFPRQKLAVFMDGDFWHGRDWAQRRKALAGGHNAGYWLAKISYNRERDERNTALLRNAGWTVLRLWETDVKRAPDEAVEKVFRVLEGLKRA